MRWMVQIPLVLAWIMGMFMSIIFLQSSIKIYEYVDGGIEAWIPSFDLPMAIGTEIWAGLLVVLGIALVIPLSLNWLMDVLKLDKTRYLHKFMLFMSYFFASALFLGIATSPTMQDVFPQEDPFSYLSKGFLYALIALLSVGWLVTRNFRETVDRLGLQRLDTKGMAIGLVVGFSVTCSFLLFHMNSDFLQAKIPSQFFVNGLLGDSWPWFVSFLVGAFGILGFELLFRGVLQPRFGLVFTSILAVLFGGGVAVIDWVPSSMGWIPFILSLILSFGLGLLARWYGVLSAIVAHWAAWFAIVLSYIVFVREGFLQ
ncbi:hypothetical protein [Pasteuria penetrans]|uniref:hypothetical protein n=1 Tax=Pasteuria penetrans TaxID=86005 RepID=UPI001CAA5FCE|nr:hypothetical protein [Pasteuria penetrans]